MKLDTIPKLLVNNAKVRGAKPAYREKDLGIWQTWTWAQTEEQIRNLACGLWEMGFSRGDKLAIIGDNRPCLYWAMVAGQCLGGVPVPLYQDSVAEEMIHVLTNADVRFAVVEDQEQTDKLLEIHERCPNLEHIIYEDPRGMQHYEHKLLHRFSTVQEKGETYHRNHPDFYLSEIEKCKGDDLAILLYTSGTTGLPKGVALSNDNIIITSQNSVAFDKLSENEKVLAYLPMAWVGDNIFSIGQAYVTGFCVNCPESPETVMADLKEIAPSYYFAPPAIYERMLTSVMIRMEDASWLKRKMFNVFMDVANQAGVNILDGKPVGLMQRCLYFLGRFLVYEPLKNNLGLTHVRIAYTAGEAIGPEIFGFFRSLGINIKQLYGQTEASVFVCMQPDGEVKDNSVGKPAPGVKVKVLDSGEVTYRSPGVFLQYHKNPEATKKAKTKEGWVYTGDAGFFDDDGHLKIIDRATDVGKMNDGTMFAPKYIENKLKFFPFIREAVVFGNQKNFATAFINIDMDAMGNWAERRNLPYSGYTDLASRPEVYTVIKECIETVNTDLARDSKLSGSQIHRFLILHKELDADDGELTRTRKVRRTYIDEKYGKLIEAMDSGEDHCSIEAKVTFEDGRTGTINADLAIRDCETIQSAVAA